MTETIPFVGRVVGDTSAIYQRVSGEAVIEIPDKGRMSWSGWFTIESGEPAQTFEGKLLVVEEGTEEVIVSGDIFVDSFSFGDVTLHFVGAGGIEMADSDT